MLRPRQLKTWISRDHLISSQGPHLAWSLLERRARAQAATTSWVRRTLPMQPSRPRKTNRRQAFLLSRRMLKRQPRPKLTKRHLPIWSISPNTRLIKKITKIYNLIQTARQEEFQHHHTQGLQKVFNLKSLKTSSIRLQDIPAKIPCWPFQEERGEEGGIMKLTSPMCWLLILQGGTKTILRIGCIR